MFNRIMRTLATAAIFLSLIVVSGLVEGASDIGDPAKYESHFPGSGVGVAAYGPGGATARPRSATVMITKNDGGVIGL